MSSFLRDTPVEQLIRLITRNKVLLYPEERPDFQLPESYTKALEAAQHDSNAETRRPSFSSSKTISDSDKHSLRTPPVTTPDSDIDPALLEKAISRNQDLNTAEDSTTPTLLADGTILVGWYGASDPANPQNWTFGKKLTATLVILAYTLSVYAGSSIFTPSYAGVVARFGVSRQEVSLTLSMYVLAYGMGPMLWSPLSEMPSIGRNPPYVITYALFAILIVPTALIENFPGLVVLRFLLGFFGSPCLATGGASFGDMYPFAKLPYAISLWAFAATSGPAIAPLIAGFSVAAKDWRWSTWEMLWMSGPIWIAMFLLLPETSSSTILLRRAQRLRAATGNPAFKSQSEIDEADMTARHIATEFLWRPMQTMLFDPSIAFTAVYTALIYGIYYSFFECFPLVYGDVYGFNLGEQGLAFLSIGVGALIAAVLYSIYIFCIIEPVIKSGKLGALEQCLIPALLASFFLPIGLFLFAWTQNKDIHWIVSAIGVAIFTMGIFIIIQCIFLYLPLGYPKYAASLFAGNDLARSSLAAGTIHFSQPLYNNLGVARGVSLVAGLTVGCIGGIFVLFFYGEKLRARSRFAAK